MNPRQKKVIAAAAVIAAMTWGVCNPPGKFGWCCFGLTTFNCLPRPVSDIQVRPDGSLRTVSKTHDLTIDRLRWLVDSKPEVLIIAIGWQGAVQPASEIRALPGCDVRFLKSDEASRVFNQLKKTGRKVAIHYHSTC